MKVIIVDSKNNKRPINIMDSEPVSELKNQIKGKNIIVGDIELLFNGQILKDNDYLMDLGITDGSIINYLGIFKAGDKIDQI